MADLSRPELTELERVRVAALGLSLDDYLERRTAEMTKGEIHREVANLIARDPDVKAGGEPSGATEQVALAVLFLWHQLHPDDD